MWARTFYSLNTTVWRLSAQDMVDLYMCVRTAHAHTYVYIYAGAYMCVCVWVWGISYLLNALGPQRCLRASGPSHMLLDHVLRNTPCLARLIPPPTLLYAFASSFINRVIY